MAMQPEFHSVNMNGAGGDDDAVELSSISVVSSATSSQRSPDSSPSTPSPPPLQLQADHEQPRSPTVPSDPVEVSSPRLSLPLPLTREQALKSLLESIPHKMTLQQLQKSKREHQKDANQHKKAVRRLSKELYTIVSLYALLQGVLFTAVAQSSVFTCNDWWGPTFIMVVVTLGTIACTLHKLHRMGHRKQEVQKFEKRQRAVHEKIEQLYSGGSACIIESLEPEHTDAFDEEPGMMCIFSLQGLLVLCFLVGFSVLITICFTFMLCRPCLCKAQ